MLSTFRDACEFCLRNAKEGKFETIKGSQLQTTVLNRIPPISLGENMCLSQCQYLLQYSSG